MSLASHELQKDTSRIPINPIQRQDFFVLLMNIIHSWIVMSFLDHFLA